MSQVRGGSVDWPGMEYSSSVGILERDRARNAVDAGWTQLTPGSGDDEGDCIALTDSDLLDVDLTR
ncbi:MAG: hypothetical protein JWM53_1705 [bacterium]|nr:hypothetical protein [bacterium]